MPRRHILSDIERNDLLAIPKSQEDLVRIYSLSERDISVINQYSRGAENRLGFTVLLCYMRYPGILLPAGQEPDIQLLKMACNQLKIPITAWEDYGERAETRREHIIDLQAAFGFQTFPMNYYNQAVQSLEAIAWQTDKGIVLVNELMEHFRSQKILFPSINVLERICAEAITLAERRIYTTLTESLSEQQKNQLKALLLMHDKSKTSTLMWLRQSPSAFNARHMLEHMVFR